jgi:D-threo-aldose 1-dehydrogenase
MQFPLRHPAVASVLLGTAKPSSLRRNVEQTRLPVPESLYAEAEAFSLVAPPLGSEAVRQ